MVLAGNLGADAAFFGANDSAASFRMATKSKDAENEYVEWHSVVAFRELANEVVEKCTKGRFIRVYRYLHHSNGGYDEAAQLKTEVVATTIKCLSEAVTPAGRSFILQFTPLHFSVPFQHQFFFRTLC